ncbi:MAG: Fur family transcriptional regulator [Rhodospirillaceae bacterium]
MKRGEKNQADVLAVLRQGDGPLTAYEVMAVLSKTHPKIAPPTVYRALAALIEQGVVHKVESLNAFMACKCDQHNQASILSICDDCGAVEESVAPKLLDSLAALIGKTGFAPQRHVLEVHGVCGSCQTEQALL